MKMIGQMSIFDTIEDGAPCRYRFKRYIGQRVRMMFGAYPGIVREGTVTEIKPYYTTVRIGGMKYAGTPYNLTEAQHDNR